MKRWGRVIRIDLLRTQPRTQQLCSYVPLRGLSRLSPGRLTLKNVSSLLPNSPKPDTVQMSIQDEGTSSYGGSCLHAVEYVQQ